MDKINCSLDGITICIPVYNHDMSNLVRELSLQATTLSIPYQILLIDDASHSFKQDNRLLSSLFPNISYEELPENIGRSKIRNLLARKAKYDRLLMMDCDCQIRHTDFLKKYIEASNHLVVCGGTKFDENPIDSDHILRWKYGKKREEFTAEECNSNSDKTFRSSNFLILKSIFDEVKFDETLVGYGHEDTLFGFSLKKKGIKVKYIDNATFHDDLASTDIYLKQVDNSLKNLLKIYKKIAPEDKKAFLNMNPSLRVSHTLKILHLSPFISFLFKLFRPLIEKNLRSNNPFIRVLDFYKLGILMQN